MADDAPTIRFVLGDQLSREISSLMDIDKKADIILMVEVFEEATYVRHHPKKIAFLFAAMRHFAQELENEGFNVMYVRLDDRENTQSFIKELDRAIQLKGTKKVILTQPGEYRVLEAFSKWEKSKKDHKLEIRQDTRFLASRHEFSKWTEGRKELRMEYFYREMRKKYEILMDENGKPEGGKWNFDSENRESLPDDINVPDLPCFEVDDITGEVLELVESRFSDHFGDLYPFNMAVTRSQALKALDHFLKYKFKNFGDYQDAMKEGEPDLFHSHISYLLNSGLLLPLEVVEKAEKEYRSGKAPLNAVEGFIRQIIGWREFIRGVYWHFMPEYEEHNYLNATRPLPDFYWTAQTNMNCMKQCITETKKNAYAHHIQRLMVLGNFSLIAGIDPKAVNEWYLIVYSDAYQWVEMPNVSGMILYADGGIVASKPYAAGGAYINRMSDYCKNCKYNVTDKTGGNACPFNYLYWDFLARNREKLANNQRLALVYKSYDKMTDDKKQAIKESAERFLDALQ